MQRAHTHRSGTLAGHRYTVKVMIAAVIFDIDGTLVDSVDAHAKAWVAGFSDLGIEVDLDAVRLQIGKGADQLLPVFLNPDAVKRLGEAINARQSKIFREAFLPQVRAFAGVRPLFERLRSDGVKCVLASSGKPADVDTNRKLAGIDGLVDAVATSEDVDQSKPSPDIVRAALQRIAPTPADSCLFVGDTPYDAEAALRSGVATIGVTGGAFDAGALQAAGCKVVYRDIEDLLQHYERWVQAPEQGPLA